MKALTIFFLCAPFFLLRVRNANPQKKESAYRYKGRMSQNRDQLILDKIDLVELDKGIGKEVMTPEGDVGEVIKEVGNNVIVEDKIRGGYKILREGEYFPVE